MAKRVIDKVPAYVLEHIMTYMDFYNRLKNGELKSLYAFFGAEKYIMKSMLAHAKEKLISAGLEDMDYHVINGKALSFAEAKEIIRIYPFMSERRIVVIEDAIFVDSDKWGKKNLDEFFNLAMGNESLLLILISDSFDKRKYGTKQLMNASALIEFDRLDREGLIRWIKKQFAKNVKNVSPSAVNYLADCSGYLDKVPKSDLYGVEAIVDLISASTADASVELSLVKEYFVGLSEGNVFKWRDGVLLGRAAVHCSFIDDLLRDGNHFVLFANFQNHLRDAYLYALLRRAGLSKTEIGNRMQKKDFMLRPLEEAYNKYGTSGLSKALTLALDCDYNIKMGGIDARLALDLLAFSIAEI